MKRGWRRKESRKREKLEVRLKEQEVGTECLLVWRRLMAWELVIDAKGWSGGLGSSDIEREALMAWESEWDL